MNSKFSGMVPYTPGEQPKNMGALIKLNTNEFPYPPSEKVKAVLCEEEAEKLQLYSDPVCADLIQAVAAYNGVTPEMVFPGNGSDEVLAFLFHGFCENGAVFPDISYGFYPVFAEMFGVNYRQIPLREDFTICLDDYGDSMETVFFANPNAPTGIQVPVSEIERLLKRNPKRLVVVDEAYVEFGGETAAVLLDRYNNLVVTRTFSKSHALAGARIGYVLASEALVSDLNTLRFSFNPYNLNRLSIKLGKAAMEDVAYFAYHRELIMKSREYTTAALRELGFTVLDSKANFIFAGANPRLGCGDFYKKLREKNILVRYWDAPRIKDYVRITIGTQEQMEKLVAATREILK